MSYRSCLYFVWMTMALGCSNPSSSEKEAEVPRVPVAESPPVNDEAPPSPTLKTGPGAVVAKLAQANGDPYWPVAPAAVLLPPECNEIQCAIPLETQPSTGRLFAEATTGNYTVGAYWRRNGGLGPKFHQVVQAGSPLTVQVQAGEVSDLGTVAFDMPAEVGSIVHGKALKLGSNEPLAGFDIRIGIMVCEESREQVIAGTATKCNPFMTSTDMIVRTDSEGNFEFPNMAQWSYYLYHGQHVPIFTGVFGSKSNGDGLAVATRNERSVNVGPVYFDAP